MTLFEKAESWLPAQLGYAAGVAVTYVRGATEIELTAQVGRTLHATRAPTSVGATVIWGERDYLIDVAALTLGEPRDGDRIVEVIGSKRLTFELVKVNGEPSWRYSDPSRREQYRIHTKNVAEENV